MTDFGQVDSFGGTPGYASPENFSVPIVSKSDLWSLGKCLLFLYSTEEVFKCLTQIPILRTSQTMNMLQSLEKFMNNNSIIEMVKSSLLALGIFRNMNDSHIYVKIEIYTFQKVLYDS